MWSCLHVAQSAALIITPHALGHSFCISCLCPIVTELSQTHAYDMDAELSHNRAQDILITTSSSVENIPYTNHIEVTCFISICIKRAKRVSLTSTSSASQANTITCSSSGLCPIVTQLSLTLSYSGC